MNIILQHLFGTFFMSPQGTVLSHKRKVFFCVSPRGTVLSHKEEYGGKASALCEWWRNERQAGRGRDEDEDEERK